VTDRDVLRTLHVLAGTTYAEQAGIRLRDTPAPLYRLLVLSLLLSTRIRADLAVDAARALIDDGMGTPDKMAAASWQDGRRAVPCALPPLRREHGDRAGRGRRAGAQRVRRRPAAAPHEADGDPKAVRELLTAFPRLGPVGADIFFREAQLVWPELRPTLDRKVLDGAWRLGLPTTAKKLAALIPDDELAVTAAALVRVALDKDLAEQVKKAT
jgi:hypothetical protein